MYFLLFWLSLFRKSQLLNWFTRARYVNLWVSAANRFWHLLHNNFCRPKYVITWFREIRVVASTPRTVKMINCMSKVQCLQLCSRYIVSRTKTTLEILCFSFLKHCKTFNIYVLGIIFLSKKAWIVTFLVYICNLFERWTVHFTYSIIHVYVPLDLLVTFEISDFIINYLVLFTF